MVSRIKKAMANNILFLKIPINTSLLTIKYLFRNTYETVPVAHCKRFSNFIQPTGQRGNTSVSKNDVIKVSKLSFLVLEILK